MKYSNKIKTPWRFSFTLFFAIMNVNAVCPSNYLNCGPGDLCLAPVFVCDGELDCINGRDEEKCHIDNDHFSNITCPEDSFHCTGSSFCLPERWRCDGHRDCKFDDDELNCKSLNSQCEGFVCKSDSKCIAKSWKCDGQKDCAGKIYYLFFKCSIINFNK